MHILLWLATILGAVAGGFMLFATFAQSTGAPQEAAGAAIALALAAIPYIAARGWDEVVSGFSSMGGSDKPDDFSV